MFKKLSKLILPIIFAVIFLTLLTAFFIFLPNEIKHPLLSSAPLRTVLLERGFLVVYTLLLISSGIYFWRITSALLDGRSFIKGLRPMQKIAFFLYLIPASLLTIIILLLYLAAVTGLFSDEERSIPVMFSLNDPHAKYTIEKSSDYLGGYYYSVEYIPDDPTQNYYMNMNGLKLKTLGVTVRNSKIDLEPFIGKDVRIDGFYDYYFSKSQCIQQVCKNLGFPTQIDINSIKVVP